MNKKRLLFLCFVSSAAVAEPVRFDLKKQDCLRLLANSPDYVAGVSVTGSAVVPAETDNESNMFSKTSDNMSFPVYLDLERNFSFLNSKTTMGSIPLAQVDIKNGKVFVNGSLFSESGEKSLKSMCETFLKTGNIDKNN